VDRSIGITIDRAGVVAFWVLATALLLWNSWAGSQFPSDDCIYAVVGRDAMVQGTWPDLTWQGSAFFEKGPVLPFTLAASMAVFGETEFVLRLPGVLAALLLLVCVYRLAMRLGSTRYGALLAVSFAIGLSVLFLNARRPMTDVPGAALGLAGFMLSAFPGTKGTRTGRAVAGGALLGLSMMTKLVAPTPFFLALAAMQAFKAFRRPSAFFVTIGTAALVVIPWHAWMSLEHGMAFWDTYLLYHVVQRTARPLVGGTGDPTYVAWLVEREGTAAALGLAAVIFSVIRAVRGSLAAIVACLIMAGASIPLLAASTSLPHYLVATVPGAALAVAVMFDSLRTKSRIVPAAFALIMVATFVANNAADLLKPDYSPGTKTVCSMLDGQDEKGRLNATFDLHDTCAAWYCRTRVTFLAHDPGYYAAIRDIPVLSGFVQEVDGGVLTDLARNGTLVLTRPDRIEALESLAADHGLEIRKRFQHNRVLVDVLIPQ